MWISINLRLSAKMQDQKNFGTLENFLIFRYTMLLFFTSGTRAQLGMLNSQMDPSHQR